VLVSSETLLELGSVLLRPKVLRYVPRSEAAAFYTELAASASLITVTERVRICRDPRDDKFLELALAGAADLLVTDDADLLVLKTYRGTRILTSRELLEGP
jgi:uncharacterized protein